jgi:hypothetical protein
MDTLKTAYVGKIIYVIVLLIISGYQFWLVIDRWVAALKYRSQFGANSGSWISLGLDTVLIGFAFLLFAGILSLGMYRKTRHSKDLLIKRISLAAFGLATFAIVALMVLVFLPTTAFR